MRIPKPERALILALIIAFTTTLVTPQAKPGGEVKTFGKSIPGLDIIVKRTPPKDTRRVSAGPRGEFDLGILPAGHYELTVVPAAGASTRTYYESPCKPCYGVAIEGTTKGKVTGVVQYRETNATMKSAVPAWIGFDSDGKQKVVGVVRVEVTAPKNLDRE